MNLASVELLDRVHGDAQAPCRIGRQGVGDAERCGEYRHPDDVVRRAAEIEASLEISYRVLAISTTQVNHARSNEMK
jgi:hypothetical protein